MARRVRVEKMGRLPKIKPGDTVPRTGYYYVEGETRIKPITEKRNMSKRRYKKARSGRR